MAQEQGQRWVKFDALGSITGVFIVNGFWVKGKTQTVTVKAPYSSTTRTLFKTTSNAGGIGGLELPVKGTIAVTTIGTGAEIYIYYK